MSDETELEAVLKGSKLFTPCCRPHLQQRQHERIKMNKIAKQVIIML